MLPSWTIVTNPNSELANTLFKQAIPKFSEASHPLMLSDRGCQYLWPGWIKLMEEVGLECSLSKNLVRSKAQPVMAFFSYLKNGIFYHNKWQGITLSEFIQCLNESLVCYNTKGIKQSLGSLNPWGI